MLTWLRKLLSLVAQPICMTPAVIIIDKYSKYIHAHIIKEATVFDRPAYLHDTGHDYHRQIS